MRVRYALLLALILLAPARPAMAQEGAAAGAVAGAVAGAFVAGPFGAIIGGIAGAAAGGAAQKVVTPPRARVTRARPVTQEPVRIRTCVQDALGRETCTTTYR